MRAGWLIDRITIQKRSAGTDSWGNPLPDAWTDHATLWSNVRHLSGSESIKSGADTSIVRASVRIRWRTDVTAGMKVVHMGANYDIEAVLPGPKREYVDLTCKRVT